MNDLQLAVATQPAQFKAKTAGEQLVDRLVTAIALGVLLPGQKLLPERDFAKRLEVSRATLRDALHQLSSMGYVTIKRGRSGGVWINSAWGPESPGHVRDMLLPRWQQLQWLFDLAKEVLPLIARVAAQRRDDNDIAALKAAVAAYDDAADREAMRTADNAIHAAIAVATHNPYYTSLDSQLRAQLTFGTGSLPFDHEIRKRALDDHDHLAQLIVEGDAAGAGEVALHHFVDLVEEPMLRLRERVLSGEPG
ncbi:MAG TPA: FCD domain-containing protein [Candidatus Limnocylindrales bacterium]|nr:FCD domain-containing protein [Candidatus Limnocylindrales bacterium]